MLFWASSASLACNNFLKILGESWSALSACLRRINMFTNLNLPVKYILSGKIQTIYAILRYSALWHCEKRGCSLRNAAPGVCRPSCQCYGWPRCAATPTMLMRWTSDAHFAALLTHLPWCWVQSTEDWEECVTHTVKPNQSQPSSTELPWLRSDLDHRWVDRCRNTFFVFS